MSGGKSIGRGRHWVRELVIFAVAIAGAVWMVYAGMQVYYKKAYPMKYESLIADACERRGLDLSLVYAVVHTESSFRPDAVSHVGARGLMQLMPDAFDWVQMRRGLPAVAEKEILFDPEVNIETGTALLRLLLDEFHATENALCAYHAGRSRVKSWLQNPEYAPDGKQVTYIPFADTRAYVERVCRTQEIYKKLYDIQ